MTSPERQVSWIPARHGVEPGQRALEPFQVAVLNPVENIHVLGESNVLSIDGDKNNVMVMEEFGSIEKAKAFAASSELKSAMAKADIASAPEIHFVVGVAHSQL